MNIHIINQSKNQLPDYATPLAAGMDLRANLGAPIKLRPLERKLIPTGLHIAIPEGFEAQIRPRSGLALCHGISVLNAPGTIDADYRGEIKVLLINYSDQDFTVQNGTRIAQLVVAKYEQVSWIVVEQLNATTRGTGAYGHTGLH